MNSVDVAIGFLMGAAFSLFVSATIITGLNDENAHREKMFWAERACKPGMMLELIDDNRAICIGGNEETWIVKHSPKLIEVY